MDAALQVVKALLGTLQEPPATPFSVLVVCSIAGIFFQIRDISRSRFSMQISKWFGGLGRARGVCQLVLPWWSEMHTQLTRN